MAGVNSADSYEQLCNFVRVVSEGSPVRHFVVHCRKALLNYSPAQNRSVPPLRRIWAYALARDFPHLTFSLNGQVRLCIQVLFEHLLPLCLEHLMLAAVFAPVLHCSGQQSQSCTISR